MIAVVLFTGAVHLACSACSACSRSEPPPAPNVGRALPIQPRPAIAVAEPPAASGADVEARHRCRSDHDCVLSCTHGAVNADWYKQAQPNGDPCEDGCASKGMTVSCEAQRCAAKQRGVLVPECTGLMKPVETQPTR